MSMITGIGAASASADPAPTGTFTGLAGKCLDNEGNITANQNPTILYSCNGTDAQKWSVGGDGTIRNVNGLCLDAHGLQGLAGDLAQTYACTTGVEMHWTYTGSTIVNRALGLCLTVQNAVTDDFTRLWLQPCDGSPAQAWSYSGAQPTVPVAPPVTAPAPSGSVVSYDSLAGTTFSDRANRAGNALVGLGAATYTLSDFSDGEHGDASGASVYGALIHAKGLTGAGAGSTVIRMDPGSSTKRHAQPASCGGGTGCPTNNMYLVSLTADGATFNGATLQGTDQGHLYNGLRYQSVKDPVLTNAAITGIPGNSPGNPGETFAVNYQHASGTATIANVTVDGQGVGASGIAMNSCSAAFNIDGLSVSGLKYSAGIALWQQTGDVTIRNWSNTGGARELGAERLGATVTIDDPNWGDVPSSGHDVTYTKYDGHDGRINFDFSSQAKVPDRKIVMYTNTPSVKSTVHVYVGGVEQPAGDYVRWIG